MSSPLLMCVVSYSSVGHIEGETVSLPTPACGTNK